MIDGNDKCRSDIKEESISRAVPTVDAWRSVHVADAGPQIIIAGDKSQRRRRPQADQAHLVDKGVLRQAAAKDQGAERHQLQGGLPFSERADRYGHLQPGDGKRA